MASEESKSDGNLEEILSVESDYLEIDSDSDMMDFPKHLYKSPGGKTKIKNILLKFFKENDLEICEKRPLNLFSRIQKAFKFGSTVAKYIKDWIKN